MGLLCIPTHLLEVSEAYVYNKIKASPYQCVWVLDKPFSVFWGEGVLILWVIDIKTHVVVIPTIYLLMSRCIN